MKNILVLGAGNFGTCLAQHLATIGHQVYLWDRSKPLVDAINQHHHNPNYQSNVKLHPQIIAVNHLTATSLASEAMIIAIPTQFLRSTLLPFAPLLKGCDATLICASKGIESDTLKLPHDIIREVISCEENLVILSGPSFAEEVINGQPTGVSVASHSARHAAHCQEIFHAPQFRVYLGEDPLGLEIAGALKNVIAIAAGACNGLGYLNNTAATLITRGLAEITRLGVSMGADPKTFIGLGGVGDLFLTCGSTKSRNFKVGYEMSKGASLKDTIAALGSIAEGVTTTKAAYTLGQQLNVRIPITDATYRVLYDGLPISEAVEQLMDSAPQIEKD
jgi:glycerol-3-phosphate dehydrogenase